jgi:hypothetical protein
MYQGRKVILLSLTVAILAMFHIVYWAYSGVVYGGSPDWVSLSAYPKSSSNDINMGNRRNLSRPRNRALEELNDVAQENNYRILVRINSYDIYLNSYSLAYLGDIRNYLDGDAIPHDKLNGVYAKKNSVFLENQILVDKLDQMFGLTQVENIPISGVNNSYSLLLPLAAIDASTMNSGPIEFLIQVEAYDHLRPMIETLFSDIYVNSSGRNMSAFLTKLGDPGQRTFPAQVIVLLLLSSYTLYLFGSYKLDIYRRKIQFFWGQTPLAYLLENIRNSLVLSLIGFLLSVMLVYAFIPPLFELLSWQYISVLSALWIILTVLLHIIACFRYRNYQCR